MGLTPRQAQVARFLYTLATRNGVTPAHAREFVSAAIAESGLNPSARNRSSGAEGLFQLLSGGYRQRAQQLGGLDNPRANALAILPDYQHYWASHPGARPGEAGAAVERSGEGAGFYARGLANLSQLGGGVASASSPLRPVPPSGAGLAAAPDTRPALASALMHQVGGHLDVMGLVQAMRQHAAAQVAAETQQHPVSGPLPSSSQHGGIAELLREGTGGPTHSTGPHVHLATTTAPAMLAALAEGRSLGLTELENPYVGAVHPGVHAPHSYHDRRFPGRYNGRPLGQATDFSGPPGAMSRFYQWARSHLR